MKRILRITVVVPTFRRVRELERCVIALREQTRIADQIILVRREDDEDTAEFLGKLQAPAVVVAIVPRPGVIAAMNSAYAIATGDIVAMTDDDAAPRYDWLAKIESAFSQDQRLGCIGGKDWQYKGEPLALDDGNEQRAGEMQWWGRVIGDHHHATEGPTREVSVVKGVNCAFRVEALRQVNGFDTRLRGTGAQVHWELGICLALKSCGWKVVFDPALGVDHFPSLRFDEDQRNQFNALAQRNMVFNETLILCEYFNLLRRMIFVVWALFIGTRGSPGLLQVPRLLAQGETNVMHRWLATLGGRWDGWRASGKHVVKCRK